MKTFICLLLCALAAYSYAAPSSDRAIVEALINNMDDAELESLFGVEQDDSDDAQLEALLDQINKAKIQWGFGSIIKAVKKAAPYVKKGYDIYKTVNGGEVQDDDDDEEVAQLEALLNEAKTQGWGSVFKKVASGIKKAAPYVKKGYDIYKSVNGGEAQDDDDDEELAQLEALLNQNKKAKIQWGLSSIVKAVKKAAPYVKKGYDIYKSVNGGEVQDDDDDVLAQAYLQSLDDEELAQLEALLEQNVNIQSWGSVWSKVKSGIKKAAPYVKTGLSLIGKKK